MESDDDDQEEPTPPPPPKPPKTTTTSSTRSVYWDPKLKKAVAIMQDGSTKHSTNIKVGPKGFLLAEWKIDLNIEPYELEITNDQIGVLEVAVVTPIVFKKPAKINIKRKADTIMEETLKAEAEIIKAEGKEVAQGQRSTSSIKKLKYSRAYHKAMQDYKNLPIDERKLQARLQAASAVAAL